ncbi:hypothetical protein B0H15DRAFT_954726 [Mycena belliarum]|uniref:Uncharacterized protein n=1 Tax=Mycena belliarum TaxID=1033014 RepID=A0AAD6TWW2_9AGAR|nr:hypothetical protein B0H15DRAFT_954726 [Mycena belliae]
MPLSNNPHYGFHPVHESAVGDPHIPRFYNHPYPGNFLTDDLVDDLPYASYIQADLCLEYTYEVETQYLLGGEFVALPVVQRVYRRDPDLRWSEIRTALIEGTIPKRYNHPAATHAPMNSATFQKFADRFFVVDLANGSEYLCEKSTGRPVEKQHSDFEWVLEMMLPLEFSEAELLEFSPQGLAERVLKRTGRWHLDRFLRATMHWLYLHSA